MTGLCLEEIEQLGRSVSEIESKSVNNVKVVDKTIPWPNPNIGADIPLLRCLVLKKLDVQEEKERKK